MATTPTKRLRARAKSAIAAQFAGRGWTPNREFEDVFVAPDSCVGPPLSVEWTLTIEADTYGGANVTGIGSAYCREVGDALMQFPDDAIDSSTLRYEEPEWRHRVLSELDAVSQGGLLDPRGDFHTWLVTDDATLDSAVREFVAMVDGPLASWIRPRRSRAEFVRNCLARPDHRSTGLVFRSTTVLALMEGMVDIARSLVTGREPDPYDDTEPRIARFEQELAHRYPEYGALQRV